MAGSGGGIFICLRILARDESRSALESPFDEFLKRPYSVVPTDAYDDLGLHVYFDDALMVVGVEFLKWAQFTWRGQRLAGEEVLVVQQFLTGQSGRSPVYFSTP